MARSDTASLIISSPNAARQKVFDTYELHEAILLHLKVAEIIKAKAIARSWKGVIETSIQLRRACFLHPAPGASLEPDPEGRRLQAQANDIIQSKFLRLQVVLSNRRFHVNPIIEPTSDFPHTKTTRTSPLLRGKVLPDHRHGVELRVSCMRWALNDQGDVLNPAGGLNSMFITQPPCTAVTMWLMGASGGSWTRTALTLQAGNGITLGLIAETAKKIFLQCQLTDSFPRIDDGEGYEAHFAFLLCAPADPIQA